MLLGSIYETAFDTLACDKLGGPKPKQNLPTNNNNNDNERIRRIHR